MSDSLAHAIPQPVAVAHPLAPGAEGEAPRSAPAASQSAHVSWLIGDVMDRERMLDMDRMVAPVRRKSFAVMAIALLLCGPWLGWWTLVPLGVAAVLFKLA